MTNETLVQLRAYLRDYRFALSNAGVGYGSLSRDADTAFDILDRQRPITPKQFGLLENITRKFGLYVESARDFAGDHRDDLVQLYQDILRIYQGYTGKKNPNFTSRHAFHSRRLNLLARQPVLYPDFVEALQVAIKGLDAVGVDTKEVSERAVQLKTQYWDTFNRHKRERNGVTQVQTQEVSPVQTQEQ